MHTLADSTQLTDLLLNKYGLAVFVGIISGLISYLTGTRLEAKKSRKTLKQLSWDMDVDARLVEVKDELRERVQVRYGGKIVKNLTTVAFRISNTGGAPVRNEFVRFAFPDTAQVLEVALEPVPEPELDVVEVTDDVPAGNRRFRIGHLEPGQSVQFRFISDGGDWAGWKGFHTKNEEGGVAFERRDISRVMADQEHVRPFVVQAVLLVLAQLVLSSGLFFDEVVQLVRVAVTLLIGGLMLPHLMPVARLLERIAVRCATGQSDPLHSNAISGEIDGHVVQAGAIHGNVTFHRTPEGSEASEQDG